MCNAPRLTLLPASVHGSRVSSSKGTGKPVPFVIFRGRREERRPGHMGQDESLPSYWAVSTAILPPHDAPLFPDRPRGCRTAPVPRLPGAPRRSPAAAYGGRALRDHRAARIRSDRLDQRRRAGAPPDARGPDAELPAEASRALARARPPALRALDARRLGGTHPLVPLLAHPLRALPAEGAGAPVVEGTRRRPA